MMAKIFTSTRYYHLQGLMAKTISFQVKNRNSECPSGALFGSDETPQMNHPSLHQESAMLCAGKGWREVKNGGVEQTDLEGAQNSSFSSGR